MNNILNNIKQIMVENIKTYLPKIKTEELEENGAIYYMNGQNGTEWDWHVNEHLSDFMVFYNDKNNLGAAKLRIYSDGVAILYLYDDNGKTLIKTIETKINAPKDEILKFAVLLKKETDDKNNWDADINKLDTNALITSGEVNIFKNKAKDFERAKNRSKIMPKMAYVSKKILEENYKIGYLRRDDPENDEDSGWSFLAGNEDDEYTGNPENIELLPIYEITRLDPEILKYIDSPIGSEFIRTSPNKFEEFTDDKKIFIEKR